MKDKIKQWLDANVWDGEDRSGAENDYCTFSPDVLQELVEECLGDISPKLEWTLTSDTPPHGDYNHIDCYIILKRNRSDVLERPWNTIHKCFDDSGYDDFEYNADDVFCWMIKPHVDLPLPPSEGE
tara:strand:+ start:19094 stop:19471 length:378 start_codon:yes stop_codon:yes gene_type:complete